jgi:hypothetical protein
MLRKSNDCQYQRLPLPAKCGKASKQFDQFPKLPSKDSGNKISLASKKLHGDPAAIRPLDKNIPNVVVLDVYDGNSIFIRNHCGFRLNDFGDVVLVESLGYL